MRFLADESCDFAVVRALRAAGHDVVAIAEITPDTLDARGLNQLQRSGTLPTVWNPPGELRDHRDAMVSRRSTRKISKRGGTGCPRLGLATRHGIVTCFFLSLLIGQWGCATPRYTLLPLPSEEVRANIGTVGVVSARFPPEAQLEAPTGGKWSGAGKGAAAGFFGAMQAGAQAGGYGGGLAILLSPVFAMGGSIYGAIAAESAEKVQEAEATLNKVVAVLKIQEAMRDRVLQVARNETRQSFVPLEDRGPTIPNEEVSYSSLTSEGVDTILEISVTKFELPGLPLWPNPPPPLIISVCGRLLKSADGTELYGRPWVYRSGTRKFVEWAANNAEPLRDEVDRGLQALAEQIVEEIFLVFAPVTFPQAVWAGCKAFVPIKDFKSIAGTWSGRIEFGLTARTTTGDSPPTMTMTIKDDGSYEVVTIKQHAGILRLVGGKIQFTVDIGSTTQDVTLTLHTRGEKRMLEGSSDDGATLWEMTRVE